MNQSMYIYRLTSDTGFAPCVDHGLFTLACCKGGTKDQIETGIRNWIGKRKETDYEKEEVYLMGIYKDNILYCAKITEVITMKEYYSGRSKSRKDDIYEVFGDQIVHKKDVDTHNDEAQIARDISGNYVLMSNDFQYFGNQCFGAEEIKKILGEDFPGNVETKKLIHSEKVEEVLKFIEGNLGKIDFKAVKPNDDGSCGDCQR